MPNSPNRASSVNISDDSGVNANNIVGGDIIHNIVIIGQLLELGKIQDLLPAFPESANLYTINDALNQLVTTQGTTTIAPALQFTANVLKTIQAEALKNSRYQIVPLRLLLRQSARLIPSLLSETGHWQNYAQSFPFVQENRRPIKNLYGLYMQGVSQFWNKTHVPKIRIYITARPIVNGTYAHFHKEFQDLKYSDLIPITIDTLAINDARAFFTGFILDLIRLGTVGAADTEYWNGLLSRLHPVPPNK